MNPDGTPKGLAPQDLNHQGDRQWFSLMDWISAWVVYPGTYTEKKYINDLGAGSVNIFGEAQARVNAEGLVVMRGLIRKNPATALAVGNVVMTIPKHIMPKWPHQQRFFGGTCMLTINPDTQQLVIDQIIFAGSDYICLNNVIYYLD